MSTVERQRSMRMMTIDWVWGSGLLLDDLYDGTEWTKLGVWVEMVVIGVFCYLLLVVWDVFALVRDVCSVAWIGNRVFQCFLEVQTLVFSEWYSLYLNLSYSTWDSHLWNVIPGVLV